MDALFPRVRDPAQTPARTFEIGLVLAGTTSTGAYTAGVLDFLLQALDAWTKAKAQAQAPVHNVLIKIVTGASGGAVDAGIFARALTGEFPPIATDPDRAASGDLNPFYSIWVKRIDIEGLTATTDIEHQNTELLSLLNGNPVTQDGLFINSWSGKPLGTNLSPAIRDYADYPLRLAVTLSNLRGIPYLLDLASGAPNTPGPRPGTYFVDHADFMRFAVDTRNNPAGLAGLRPDEVAISQVPMPGDGNQADWMSLVQACLASSASPAGLPARPINRSLVHYNYRYALVPDGNGIARVTRLQPDWSMLAASANQPLAPRYDFLSVDGGVFNDRPTELARTWLAGVCGHNSQDGQEAKRAIVLVEPLGSEPNTGVIGEKTLMDVIGSLVTGAVAGGRFLTADLLLMTDKNVYSRFLVTPNRKLPSGKAVSGEDAVVGGALGSFMGFLSEAFRWHDYQLGRHNCWEFLRRDFMLPKDNDLFGGWSNLQKTDPAYLDQGHLPIIPLVGECAAPPPLPTWPQGKLDLGRVKPLIRSRVKAVLSRIETSALGGEFIAGILKLMANGPIADGVTDYVVGKIQDDVKKYELQ
jgi:predicted acylesterase/phospholipase RssA